MTTSALLCVDLVNDYVHADGALAGGMANNAQEILPRIARIQEHFRSPERLVIHVGTWFMPGYPELYSQSPLYGEVKDKGALLSKEWGGTFHELTAPKDEDPRMHKHRSSAFFRTRLEIVLRANRVDTLYIVGADTSGSIESTVRAAHDGDFNTVVISDACIGRSDDEQKCSLNNMARFAEVLTFGEVSPRLVR